MNPLHALLILLPLLVALAVFIAWTTVQIVRAGEQDALAAARLEEERRLDQAIEHHFATIPQFIDILGSKQ